MRDSLRIGRIGGVRVGVHWSLLAIVVLVGYGLAHNRLPYDAPGHSAFTYDMAGAATAVGLMAGVLLHEMGHAVVARLAGLRVDGITLSWMGGITRIEGDSHSPGWEAAIAGVGPAVSLGVGGLCALLRAVLGSGGGHAILGSSLGWLAVINVSLALFNLVPAAPLDGGRVLHAAIWRGTHDQYRATRTTSRIGVGFGALIVAVAFLAAVRGASTLQSMILIFLGYWIIAAARAEEQVGGVRRALEGATMRDLMRPVGSAPGWITIQAFVDRYDSARPGWVWLLERWGGGYDGVLPGEAARAVPVPKWATIRPMDIAVPVATAAGAAPGDDALDTLARTGGQKIVLVVDGGHTIGAVLPSDVEALIASGGPATPHPAGAQVRPHH